MKNKLRQLASFTSDEIASTMKSFVKSLPIDHRQCKRALRARRLRGTARSRRYAYRDETRRTHNHSGREKPRVRFRRPKFRL